MRPLLFALWLLAGLPGTARTQPQPPQPAALVGLDHVPVAVKDLAQAAQTFSRLGFTLKPGRAHANSIRNQHIKFVDGSGLELITARTPDDALSAFYLQHLKQGGDGPAFLALHAADMAAVQVALVAAGIGFSKEDGLITFKDPQLSFLFITPGNRSPTDLPVHFSHANGAFALREVWVATDEAAPLRRLLQALGARERQAVVGVPVPTQAAVFALPNGRVVLVPAQRQQVPGRAVLGVVMAVQRAAASVAPAARAPVAPQHAHGLWLQWQLAR